MIADTKLSLAGMDLAPGARAHCKVYAFVLLLMLSLSDVALAQMPLEKPEGPVLLRVSGNILRANVGGEAHFDRVMINALPERVLETSTSVSEGMNTFEGILMRDLLAEVGASGEVVIASGLNGYAAKIPIEDFTAYDVIVASVMDGKVLTPRDKGPLWIVYPRDDFDELRDIRYDYRWVWQLSHIEVR